MIKDDYYHISNDLERYPDAVVYVVWSPRGQGKTYSALWESYKDNIPIVYLKRTKDDVEMICESTEEFDASPYVPINRDKGTSIHCKLIKKGIGGAYESDDDGKPTGSPIAYIISLNSVKTVKGFDLSNCDWMVLDEFIPQQGEIVRHCEGQQLLDLYMTINRDRTMRGRKPLKLMLFANAEEISTPITNMLEIVDDMTELNASGRNLMYLPDRKILLHHITQEEYPKLAQANEIGMAEVMKGTSWYDKSFGGNFANNDFSNVAKVRLKGYKPRIDLLYKRKHIYLYQNDVTGEWYATHQQQKCMECFNLDTENGQKNFYYEYVTDLRFECIEGRMRFEKYSMYDLIINYKNFFKI